jgi:hypothetical protein
MCAASTNAAHFSDVIFICQHFSAKYCFAVDKTVAPVTQRYRPATWWRIGQNARESALKPGGFASEAGLSKNSAHSQTKEPEFTTRK